MDMKIHKVGISSFGSMKMEALEEIKVYTISQNTWYSQDLVILNSIDRDI